MDLNAADILLNFNHNTAIQRKQSNLTLKFDWVKTMNLITSVDEFTMVPFDGLNYSRIL